MGEMEDRSPGCEDAVPYPGGSFSQKKEVIPYQRRLQLQKLATEMSATLMERAKPHEYCLVRSMVEDLLPR